MNALTKIPLFCLLLIIIYPFASLAQSLSKDSKRVKLAFEELQKSPESRQKQLTYLQSFPINKKQFIAVFNPEDFSQLYSDSHRYILAFFNLSKSYPEQVMDRSINIGKDLKWDADAVGDLQQSIVALANVRIKMFSVKLKSLQKFQADNLIAFLADVENHKAYPEYQQLIDNLNKIGAKDLADRFIRARSKRENEKNH